MSDGSDSPMPERRPARQPDSIWERYLTGKLSLTDKEVLPALIKELHREIAEHLGKRGDKTKKNEVEPDVDPLLDLDPIVEQLKPPTIRKPIPVIDISALRSHLLKRRPIDPRRN